MKAAAVQKAMKAMSAKKTITEPEAIARTRWWKKPMVVKPMKAAGRAQMTKIRKDASDGKKRQVSTKLWATCDMKEPAPMESNCCDVC